MDTIVSNIIDKLKDDYLNNIHIIEMLKHKKVIIKNHENNLVVETNGIFYIKSDDAKFIKEFIINNDVHYLCLSSKADIEKFLNETFVQKLDFYNWAYLSKEIIPLSLKAEVKKIDESYLSYIVENYKTIDSIDYIKETIAREMLGIFLDGNIIGFIGIHEELSMGLLYIDKNYRQKGYGYLLEASLINKLLSENKVPFAQVSNDNIASVRLQKKLCLKKSDKVVSWLIDRRQI